MMSSIRRICFVAPEGAELGKAGGAGTYTDSVASVLARNETQVFILNCGALPAKNKSETRNRLEQMGVCFSHVSDFSVPTNSKVSGWPTGCFEASDKIRNALELWHRVHKFEIIEFADRGGLGFRSIQAKQARLAFQDTPLLVRLHNPTRWCCESSNRRMGEKELLVDYCERYAFENADIQLVRSGKLMQAMRESGWKIRQDARVTDIPGPEMASDFTSRGVSTNELEIVYFGRLEQRKGLDLFVAAADQFATTYGLTFLGIDIEDESGCLVSEILKEDRLSPKSKFIVDADRFSALNYLREGNRIAIMPYRGTGAAYATRECALLGLPFLATLDCVDEELRQDPDLRDNLLFQPTEKSLSACLHKYLNLDKERRRFLAKRAQAIADAAVKRCDKRVTEYYINLASPYPSTPETQPEYDNAPLVSVVVTHYNLGMYLPDTLAALARQTYPKIEVLVVDDCSTDPLSLSTLAKEEATYPQFRFIRLMKNGGVSAARNHALAESRGDLFLPVDADNIPTTKMVETFVQAIQANPGLSAMSCYLLKFRNNEDLVAGRFFEAYRPAGGPITLGCIYNLFGDTNGIFRTNALRAIGGFDSHPDNGQEDWHLYVKLAINNFHVGVVPEYLYYYRSRANSRFNKIDRLASHRHILRQYQSHGSLGVMDGTHLLESLVVGLKSVAFWKEKVEAHKIWLASREQINWDEKVALRCEISELNQRLKHSQDQVTLLALYESKSIVLAEELRLMKLSADLSVTRETELRRLLHSRRHRLAEIVHTLLQKVPGALSLAKNFCRVTSSSWRQLQHTLRLLISH